jgi:hypothetical protein
MQRDAKTSLADFVTRATVILLHIYGNGLNKQFKWAAHYHVTTTIDEDFLPHSLMTLIHI